MIVKILQQGKENNPERYYIRYTIGNKIRLIMLQIDDGFCYLTDMKETYSVKQYPKVLFEGLFEDFCKENSYKKNDNATMLLNYFNKKIKNK